MEKYYELKKRVDALYKKDPIKMKKFILYLLPKVVESVNKDPHNQEIQQIIAYVNNNITGGNEDYTMGWTSLCIVGLITIAVITGIIVLVKKRFSQDISENYTVEFIDPFFYIGEMKNHTEPGEIEEIEMEYDEIGEMGEIGEIEEY
jgi:hypothetical protein